MKKLIIVLAIAFTAAACNKDKFKTIPQVTITSFGPDEVVKGDVIELNATINDQEGDLQDSIRIIQKTYNGATVLKSDSLWLNIKALKSPQKREIELRVWISYGVLRPGATMYIDAERFADRQFTVGLIVQDNAKNRSEYVESKKILLKKL